MSVSGFGDVAAGGPAAPVPSAALRAPATRYVLGPAADAFLIGPGATIVVAALVLGLMASGRAASATAGTLTLWLAWAFVGPHYGATYRRAYSSLAIMRAHPWVTFVAPPLLLGAAVIAARQPATFGLAYFAAYVGWTGYHYSRQSLGLAMVYPLRQGARLDVNEKRLVSAPLIVSWILSLLGLFRGAGSTRNPAYELVRRAYHGPSVPPWLIGIGLGALAVTCAGVAVVGCRRARRGAPLPWPTYAVLATQVSWSVFGLYQPYFNVMLVPIFHALQYLAFTGWHASHGPGPGRWRRLAFFVVPTVIVGLAIYPGSFSMLKHGLVRGNMMILAAALATFINLHHFLLDGRVWRMREPRVVQSMVN